MRTRDFNRLAERHRVRGATRNACWLVLIEKQTGYVAAAKTGVAESTISRALVKMARRLCPQCGQPIKSK